MFDVIAPSAPVDLVVRRELPLPMAADYDYRSINPSTNDEQVLLLPTSTPVPLTPGPWYLGVARLDVATNDLTYAIRATSFTSVPPSIMELTNALPFTNDLTVAATQYYQFRVSTNAVQANFELLGLTGDADLFIRPGSSLPGTNNFAYASTNAGTNAEFIAVATNSLPVALTAGDWFIGVVNRDSTPLSYSIQATEFIPATPLLVELTNGVPFTNTVLAGTGEYNQRADHYLFNVQSNDTWAAFEVWDADVPLDLFVRRETPLATADTYDYLSVNPGTNYEQVLVITNSTPVPLEAGAWSVGVVRLDAATQDVHYVVQALAFNTAPPAITTLSNAVAVTAHVPGDGTQYYQFNVSSNAVQANFELTGLTGNVDLYVRPGSSMPGPDNYVYASTNSGAGDEWVIVTTNSVPVPIMPGGWFLAVVNKDALPVDYTVRVTEFVAGTDVVQLTNGVPFTNDVASVTNRLDSSVDYYVFTVSTNAVRAQFEVLDLDSDVTMVLRHELPLPTLTQYDYQSANPSTNNEEIVIYDFSSPVPLGAGDWYLGVVKLETNQVNYIVRFNEFSQYSANLLITGIQPAADELCLTWTNTVPGVPYYLQGAMALGTSNWFAASPTLTADDTSITWCLPQPTPFRFFRVAEGPAVANAELAVRISDYGMNTNGMALEWISSPVLTFQVEWAPTVTGPWQSFNDSVTSTNGLFRFTDDGSQTGGPDPIRFYRLKSQP